MISRFTTKYLFSAIAYLPILVLIGISTFMVLSGLPVLISPNFYSTEWYSPNEQFGVIPLLVGSIVVTFLSLLISVPLSLSSAIMITQYITSKPIRDLFQISVFLFAGIPPVVYGFWGLTYVVPEIRLLTNSPGYSILATCLLLALMEIPTLTLSFQSAIHSVPIEYREAAMASSGASKLDAIFRIVIPICMPGIIAGIVLGLGRAMGETTAILMTSGNVAQIPTSLTSPVRTITTNIALELGESTGLHRQALYATGTILLVFLLASNWLLHRLRRADAKEEK